MATSARKFLLLFVLSRGVLALAGSSFVTPAQQRTSRHGRRLRTRGAAHRRTPCAVHRGAAMPRGSCELILSVQSKDVAPDDGGDNRNNLGEYRPAWRHYLSMMRPITILQAVGSFLVGRLVVLPQQRRAIVGGAASFPIVAASLSIYLGYGAGMAMNDCADVGVDSLHAEKRGRSLASNSLSVRSGWLFSFGLFVLSTALALLTDASSGNNGFRFAAWSVSNTALMAGYALGMQRLFLVKNLLCGFFAISPLLGATLLGVDAPSLSLPSDIATKLYRLAAVGFPLQVAREILKDVEDVETDRGEKSTLPLAIGESNSKRVAYGLVGIVNGAMLLSPHYWRMFASSPPVYAVSVAVGTPMCVAASWLPLAKGQRLLKKSIYVLLSGMISGLLIGSMS